MKYLKKYRSEILIFSFFVLLAIVATYPLIFKMRSYLYGLGGDSFGAVWYFWWLKYAHLNQIPHLFCQFIASPIGVDYSQFPNLVVMNFFAKWLSILVNEIFTFNFFILTSFFLSAIIVYYLVYYFTKNKLASMVSGIIYTLCPYHFAHSAPHLTLANIQWMPLYIFLLFKLDKEKQYGWAILCGGLFALNTFSDYQYGYFMAVFTVAFILWRVWYGWRGKLSSYRAIKLSSGKHRLPVTDYRSPLKTVKVLLVAIIVAVAIILPFTYHFLPNMFITPERYARPVRDLTSNSARPLGYLLPSQGNPLFGRFTKKFIKSPFYGGHPIEHTLYLGWVGILLSIIAIRNWRRKNRKQRIEKRGHQVIPEGQAYGAGRLSGEGKNRSLITDYRSQKAVSFFLFAGIVALIFSHSPYTDIGNFRILFPSYFMYKILPMFRCYARFGIVVMLCVSVLAGIGLASILQKIKNAKKRRVFFATVLLLVFIEFAPTLPAPMVNAVNPPPVYEWLAKQKGDFTIAEYPIETDYEYSFWQRIHQKRLVNGAQPGTYADEVRKEIVDILKPETPGILKYLGAKYVILHPDKYLKSEDVPIIGEVPDVSKQGGLKLVRTFEEARVYEVTAVPQRPKVEKVGK